MSFGPASLRGAGAEGLPGQIDYRLARNSIIKEFKRGRLSRLDVCDAHPELMRAATHVGAPTAEQCPICEARDLVLVSYAFGPHLPPSGQCFTSAAELARLSRRAGQVACYVVEVCPDCRWNHLTRTYISGRPRSRA
ncbi:MAG TPA: DUF5318 family protein [Acidimicrobiales bacterium]|jgi:hypothetical protein|nr:DUF5318 family protein [Acidimicrobiales bacterium]